MAPRKRTTPVAPEAEVPEVPEVSAAPGKPVRKPRSKAEPKAAPEIREEAAPALRKRAPRVKKNEVPAEPVLEPKEEVASAPAPEASPELVLPAPVQAILRAIASGQAVELVFRDADANPPRTFEPRQILFEALGQAWYVWGWDRRYNAERHHRLDLLAEVNPVEGVGRAAQGPYAEGTPFNQIGGWLGGEPIPVKVLLSKQWVFAVKQAPAPFPAFQLQDAEDGKALATFTATDLRAIARWCMQFGDGIQVLEPARLNDRLKQVGIAWGGKPAAVPAAPPPAAPKPKAKPEPETRRHPEPAHEARRRPEPREESPAKTKGSRVEVRVERL